MKRILIIAGGLQIGGAEKFCANISLYAPAGKYEFHYVVFEGYENVYGPEIEKKGGKVFTIPSPGAGYPAYFNKLRSLMNQYQYDAIHSNTMFNSGINLWIARQEGIPVRIAHSHTTRTEHKVSAGQKLYESWMRLLIRQNATHLFACGIEAGEWLYGKELFRVKGRVILNGISFAENRFNESIRVQTRSELQLENRFVIGHTGSLIPVKNQRFLIDLMPEIIKRKQNALLLLIGEGEDRPLLEERIRELHLEGMVTLFGATLRVQDYLNAFDVFVFPSLREGTPLSLLEAQANGLPCIISEAVPSDAFFSDLIHVISRNDPEQWISLICKLQRNESEKYGYLAERSGFSIEHSNIPVYDTYDGKEIVL